MIVTFNGSTAAAAQCRALRGAGGFPSRYPRRIVTRDGRERRDTRNKGLRVARLSRWPSLSLEQLTEADLLLPNLERCVLNRLSHWSRLIGHLSHVATAPVG